MAPERVNGEEPRPAVDLWSLGATLYAAVEGRPPFARGEAMATMMSVVSEHPAPMRAGRALAPVLHGLLTKDPAARASADQARQQLSAVVAGAPATPAPPPPAAPPGRSALPPENVERIDSDDLRALASASKALLSSVARDARDQARHLAEKRRERKGESGPAPRPPAAGGRAATTTPVQAPVGRRPGARHRRDRAAGPRRGRLPARRRPRAALSRDVRRSGAVDAGREPDGPAASRSTSSRGAATAGTSRRSRSRRRGGPTVRSGTCAIVFEQRQASRSSRRWRDRPRTAHRPGRPGGNTIGWLGQADVARVQDDHVAEVAGTEQA